VPSAGASGQLARTLGATLPNSALRATQGRARKLRSLPAPSASVPITASLGAHKSPWSLPLGVILALIAIAAAGAAAAFARHRRQTA
jgi:hypothetical protein